MNNASDHGYATPTPCSVCHSYEFPCLCQPQPAFMVIDESRSDARGETKPKPLGYARTELGARRILKRHVGRKVCHMVRASLGHRNGPTAWVEI